MTLDEIRAACSDALGNSYQGVCLREEYVSGRIVRRYRVDFDVDTLTFTRLEALSIALGTKDINFREFYDGGYGEYTPSTHDTYLVVTIPEDPDAS